MTSSTPPAGPNDHRPGTEYLEQGGGARLPREPRTHGGGRRRAVLAGVGVLGLAAVGGGVWAAASFLSTGAQPAEALPASTLGYASIDLDPSGGQKIEAIRMLNKFPAFKDEIGLDTDDNIKQKLFDEGDLAEACDGLDYASDIEPWLGDRAAIAAVDLGEDTPSPVAVVQVKDADAAAVGLAKIRECADGEAGWTIEGDWAVVAETDSLARKVVTEADTGTLADDADYRARMDEVGDAGVLNLYAAPAAGEYLADHLDGLFPFGTAGAAGASVSSDGTFEVTPTSQTAPELPDEVLESLRSFKGMAATLRFDDGALEFEAVAEAAPTEHSYSVTEAGDDVLASLPSDTAVALGFGLPDGWAQDYLDQMAAQLGGAKQVDRLVAQAEQWTGLDLPEDAETLFGDSTAVAIGSDFDPEVLENSEDGSGVPVAVVVKGDAAGIEGVLDKVRARLGEPVSVPLGSRSDGDVVAIGPDEGYRAKILEDGGLGASETFQDVVRESEQAGAIVFVNFNAGDWMSTLVDDEPDGSENLEPLEAFGVSAWQDGDTGHALVRLTTD